MSEPHLWEVDHPYYCTEGNFHRNGQHLRHESWAEFMATWGDNDPDYNLLFRWDWQSWRRHRDPVLRDESADDELELFFVLQRKADLWSHSVAVTDEDEPAVREWLVERAKTMTALWEPLNLALPERDGAE